MKYIYSSAIALIFCIQLFGAAPLRWDWNNIPYQQEDFLDTLKFPQNFVFGVADSAYQTEGSAYYDGKQCENNWTEWEKQSDEHGKPRVKDGHKVGRACNKWELYKDDIALMKECGFKSYRFSIEWSKVEPEEGVFDERALDHYSDVVNECLKQGIEPIVMLFHQTWPLWFDKKGAFERSENISDFVSFGNHVFNRLHDRVKTWMTINEPTGYAMAAYFTGDCSPGKKSLQLAGIVLKNFLDTHVELYKSFKQIDPSVSVGYTKVVQLIDQYHNWNPLETMVSSTFDSLVNDTDLNYFKTGVFSWRIPMWCNVYGENKDAVDALDYIGVNYYSHTSICMQLSFIHFIETKNHPFEITTDNGNAIYPEGMYRSIARCAVLKKLMYIAENGLADNSDTLKDLYIKQHLYAIAKACEDGYDVRGYFFWTLIDNFEWHKGYTEKFGLYSFDPATQVRTMKDGARAFIEFVQKKEIYK